MIEEIVRVPCDEDSIQHGFDVMGERADQLAAHLGMVKPIRAAFCNDQWQALFTFEVGGRRKRRPTPDLCDFDAWAEVGGVVLLLTDAEGMQAAVRLVAVLGPSSTSLQ